MTPDTEHLNTPRNFYTHPSKCKFIPPSCVPVSCFAFFFSSQKRRRWDANLWPIEVISIRVMTACKFRVASRLFFISSIKEPLVYEKFFLGYAVVILSLKIRVHFTFFFFYRLPPRLPQYSNIFFSSIRMEQKIHLTYCNTYTLRYLRCVYFPHKFLIASRNFHFLG